MSVTTLRAYTRPVSPRLALVVKLTLFLAATSLLMSETVASMIHQWVHFSSYHHGLAVLPLVAIMVWKDRKALADQPIQPWFLPALPGAIACLVWLIGAAANVFLVQQAAFVAIVICGVASMCGKAMFRTLNYPMLFLFFMVPFGESLVGPLQTATTKMVTWSLEGCSLAYSVDGVLIRTDAATFNIAEACAGLNFLIAAIMICGFYAHFTLQTWRCRLLFVSLAALFAILANGLRASLMVVIATKTNLALGTGNNHLFLGWICYALAFVCLLMIGKKLASLESPRVDTAPAYQATSWGAMPPISLFIAVASASIYNNVVVENRPQSTGLGDQTHLSAPGWRILPPTDDWRGSFNGADSEIHATYRRGSSNILLSQGYYSYDRQNAEIVGAGNVAYDKKNWRRHDASVATFSLLGNVEQVTVNHLFDAKGRRLLSIQFYWLGDKVYADPRFLKLQQVADRLTGKNSHGGVFIIAAPYRSHPEDAIAAIRDFLSSTETISAWLERQEPQQAT